MKVLVTGGAGFIGSNLCEHRLEEGHEVLCLDNFCTGKPENILPLLETYPDAFSLVVGDIRNLDDCNKAVDGMEYVLHEAALGDSEDSRDFTYIDNVIQEGLKECCRWCTGITFNHSLLKEINTKDIHHEFISRHKDSRHWTGI